MLKAKIAGSLLSIALGAIAAAPAQAQINTSSITFDGLCDGCYLPSAGYSGLFWENWAALDAYTYYTGIYSSNNTISGYQNAAAQVISPFTGTNVQYVGFNSYGNSATISSPTTAGFNLTDGGFGAAWSNGLSVTAYATFENGSTASSTFIIGTGTPTVGTQSSPTAGTGYFDVQFNWTNLASVTFIPSGGTNAGLDGQGNQFALTFLNASANAGTSGTDYLANNGYGLGTVNWSSSSTWLGVAPPATGHNVFITNLIGSNSLSGTNVVLDMSASLNNLLIDGNSPTDAPVTLSQSANTLVSNTETIGSIGTAVHAQSGGTNTTTSLTVNPYGSYLLSGGTLNAGNLQVTGGKFTQTGGSVTVGVGGGGTTTNSGNISVSNGTFTTGNFFNATSSGILFGSLTIGAGGKVTANNYTQLAGVTTLAGGSLDPAVISFQGGTLVGNGIVKGSNITFTKGASVIASGGTLQIQGNYTQTGGSITFADAVSRLMFDPGLASISGAQIIFKFLAGNAPSIGSTFASDNYFLSSNGQPFSTAFNLGNTFKNDSFVYEVGTGPLYDLNFNAGTGSLTTTNIAAVPEPETYVLMLAGFGFAGVVARRRRRAYAGNSRSRSYR